MSTLVKTKTTSATKNGFYYVYLLQSISHDNLYVGYTQNLSTRLKQHNAGTNSSTKAYVPWDLIHYEAYRNQQDALRREKYLKTSQGKRMLRRGLKEYFYNKSTHTV